MFCRLVCLALYGKTANVITEVVKDLLRKEGYSVTTDLYDIFSDVVVTNLSDDLDNNLLLSVHQLNADEYSEDLVKSILANERKF